jgi:leucyl-tRNA synthetase
MAWDPAKLNYWFPVDYYFGGDHAVSHLLYFRFWNHFFADQGLVDMDKKEPVKRLVFNGYINAADGSKMSKSKGNVVDPLDIIDSGYGADALRMYELFVGPYDQDVVWNPNGVPGTYRFLQRVWTLVGEVVEAKDSGQKPDSEKSVLLASFVHKTIKKVTEDLETQRFNTAIAACMELVNSLNKLKEELPMADAKEEWQRAVSQLLQLLAPFSPHIAEELWADLGHTESIHTSGWPIWDEDIIKDEMITVVIQVNGKVRANVTTEPGVDEKTVLELANGEENVQNFTSGKTVIKTIFVKDKLLNIVVK